MKKPTPEQVEKTFTEIEATLPPEIDITEFEPLSIDELIETLGITIKKDIDNKLVAFLCALSAYTPNDQFNVSFNAPSSSGKSYIPTEIARLFPQEDVQEMGYCSPTSFFHETGEYDKETNTTTVDLSHKILTFLDQPHMTLLTHLRPLLSHDKKVLHMKITDKNQRGGNRTKTVKIIGYPAVFFCTAGLRLDEQESTRFVLLSPEINQEKLRAGIHEKIHREADHANYTALLAGNAKREQLIRRILAIKYAEITDIKITKPDWIEQLFMEKNIVLKPKHQRDIGRVLCFIKAFALLNFPFRELNNGELIANDDDIKNAFKIWEKISVSQELNLPPYVYNLYLEVLVPAWRERNGDITGIYSSDNTTGLSQQDIQKKHLEIYGRMLDTNQWRFEVLPALEVSGLVSKETDPTDRRRMLIYPLMVAGQQAINSEPEGGVDEGVVLEDLEELINGS